MSPPAVLGHPDVWVTAFDQPERKRIIVSALRLTNDVPGAPEAVTVGLRVPEDSDVTVDVFDMAAIELTPHPLDIVVSMGESSKQCDY